MQEQKKRGRADDSAKGQPNPSKRARLEGADVSGLGSQAIEDGAEEEEQKQSKQPPAKDRTFSFKVILHDCKCQFCAAVSGVEKASPQKDYKPFLATAQEAEAHCTCLGQSTKLFACVTTWE